VLAGELEGKGDVGGVAGKGDAGGELLERGGAVEAVGMISSRSVSTRCEPSRARSGAKSVFTGDRR
jgi:hypothetical protein